MDLIRHKMLVYDYAINPTELPFRRRDETATVNVRSFISANDGQFVLKAALDDLGILIQPKYIVQDHLERGELVSVLDDWDLPRLTMNIAFQTRRHMPAKVRLFIEALAERFRKMITSDSGLSDQFFTGEIKISRKPVFNRLR